MGSCFNRGDVGTVFLFFHFSGIARLPVIVFFSATIAFRGVLGSF